MPKRKGQQIIVRERLTARNVTVKKARAKKRNRMPRQMRSPPVGPATAKYIASLRNPFDVSACIPDGVRGVGCFSVKQMATIGTGTGTACAFALNPNLFSFSFTDTGSTAATPTTAGNWVAPQGYTAIQSSYGKYRPISAGIRATYVGNTQTDQGTIMFGQVAGSQALSSFSGATVVAAANGMQWYEVVPLRNGAEFTWRPEDPEDTNQFLTILAAGATTQQFNAPWLICAVYGASANTANLLTIEYVVNFEGQFAQQTFLAGGIDVASRDNSKHAEAGWFEAASNFLSGVKPMASAVGSIAGNAIAQQVPILTQSVANAYMNRNNALGYMGNGYPAPGRLSLLYR
jgi:hypothetical protein